MALPPLLAGSQKLRAGLGVGDGLGVSEGVGVRLGARALARSLLPRLSEEATAPAVKRNITVKGYTLPLTTPTTTEEGLGQFELPAGHCAAAPPVHHAEVSPPVVAITCAPMPSEVERALN